MIRVTPGTNEDLEKLFRYADQNLDDTTKSTMQTLWEMQKKALKVKDRRSMRWHPR